MQIAMDFVMPEKSLKGNCDISKSPSVTLKSQSQFQVAEVELIYRQKVHPESRPYINCSTNAYKILKSHWDENKINLLEQFKIILLDHRNNCLGICDIATGGIAMCPVDSKIVFAAALAGRASQIMLAHNHPSGNLQPSPQDIAVTNRLAEGAKILDMKCVDHIIMTSNGYYSFADHSLMP